MDYIEFDIIPEVESDQYDTVMTLYRKTYTRDQIDFSMWGMDFGMTKDEVKKLITYLTGRLK